MQRRTFLYATASSAVLLAFRKQLSFAKGAPAVKLPPLLAPFGGPYGGVPAFGKFKAADFKPALLQAMDLQRSEIQAIVDNKDAPTFENTFLAFEDAGRPFNRASAIMGVYTSTMNDKEMQAIEQEMARSSRPSPTRSSRTRSCSHASRQSATSRSFAIPIRCDWSTPSTATSRDGARRSARRRRPSSRNSTGKLATLYTTFGQNLLADEESQVVVLDKKEDLAGSRMHSSRRPRQKPKRRVTRVRG
jgi:peptidyl-dipeptidase Dcp